MNQKTEGQARRERAAFGRRLIAAGIIRRQDGRTLTVRATQAGVTGSIRPAMAR